MGRFFSDPVERALKYIYYDLRARRGQEGFQLLQQAVRDGDADACCLLARCLYGPEYTWPGHNFPVDDRAGDELMRRSVLEGSAIGALLSLRCGVMNRRSWPRPCPSPSRRPLIPCWTRRSTGSLCARCSSATCLLLGRFPGNSGQDPGGF